MNTFTLVLFIAVGVAAVLAYPAEHHEEEKHEYHAVPAYHYEYGVHDPHTHDQHSQFEHRDHDAVKGGYVIHEADGTKRIVEYTSNKKDGFQAVVRREGHAQHPGHKGEQGGTSYVGVTHWGHGSGR